ncbi:MAG TPA: hypothetical protein VFQ65_31835 [Kofleriaceae bacterium]|nr:hypothetical protein [Kofleriaceae bacterium]
MQSREAAMVHVRCAEHGQLVHVRSAGPDHVAAAPVGTAVVALPSSGDAASDHDHCALIGANHCVQLAAAALVTSTALAIAPDMAPELVSYSTRATFRIAPKNSPPA